MKRLLAFLLALFLCFSLIACQKTDEKKNSSKEETKQEQKLDEEPASENDQDQAQEQTQEQENTQEQEQIQEQENTQKKESQVTPLLYKVTDEDGNVVWLFGSIHLGQEEYYPLPEYVEDAFLGADALAVEADIVAFEKDLKAQVRALKILMYSDLSTIDDHIPGELYERSVEILEELGSYDKALDYYCPYVWADTIVSYLYQQDGADFSLGIDRHLLNWAKDTEKTIYEIESAEFQYGMLAGFSDELQIYLLEDAIRNYEDPDVFVEHTAEMMELWASGDEEAFAAYLMQEEDVSEEETLLYEEYQTAMIVNRNEGMANYAEEALESGEEVFICVGAAHVVGEGAMADLLSQRGYTVELVQ